jgi:hypothetical protein
MRIASVSPLFALLLLLAVSGTAGAWGLPSPHTATRTVSCCGHKKRNR